MIRPFLIAPAAVVLAACAGDNTPSADGTTAAEGSSTGIVPDDDDDDDDATTGTVGMTMGDDDDDDATETSTDTGPSGCQDDTDCQDPDFPFCDDPGPSGACVACDVMPDPDAACAGANPDVPLCDLVEGTCVQCTEESADACTDTTPVCDTTTQTCIGCTHHDQCPESACHIPSRTNNPDPDDGACFDPLSVVHVDGDGGMDFSTIAAAVASVGAGGEGVVVIHDWSGNYDEAITIDADERLVLMSAEGETPTWLQGSNDPGANPHLEVEGTAIVWLHRMAVNQNGDPDGPAIDVSGARVHATRSRITNNNGGSIGVSSGGVLDVDTCFVGGLAGSDTAALAAGNGDVAVTYSTLGAAGFDAIGLTCSIGADVTVTDSIVAAQDDTAMSCTGASLTTSAEEASVTTSWFANYSNGDFDLQPGHPFGNVAEWNDGDPPTDIDGTPRPDVDGTPDVAGAHLP